MTIDIQPTKPTKTKKQQQPMAILSFPTSISAVGGVSSLFLTSKPVCSFFTSMSPHIPTKHHLHRPIIPQTPLDPSLKNFTHSITSLSYLNSIPSHSTSTTQRWRN